MRYPTFITGWLILGLACVASLVGAEPSAGEPALTFAPESVSVSLRLSLTGAPDPVQPDHKLTLAAPVPRGFTALRVAAPRFEPARTDTGERLGLLVRPANRVQIVAADHLANRDSTVRLILDLTPPRRDCASLLEVRGTVTVTLGVGPAKTLALSAAGLKPGTTTAIPDLADGTVIVEEGKDRRLVLRCSPALAERLGQVVITGAGDAVLAPRPGRVLDSDKTGTRYGYDCDLKDCARVSLSWFAEVRTVPVAVAVARLDLPGGLPGIGEREVPPPAKPPKFKPPLLQAIANGDRDEVRRLLATGADPLAEAPDGRNAFDLARDLGRWRVLRVLLGNED